MDSIQGGTKKDLTGLNMDFYQHYQTGKTVAVDVPEQGERVGKVIVTGTLKPVFMLKCGKGYYELVKGSRFIGYPMRKTRSDCMAYLNNKIPTFRPQGMFV